MVVFEMALALYEAGAAFLMAAGVRFVEGGDGFAHFVIFMLLGGRSWGLSWVCLLTAVCADRIGCLVLLIR